MKKTILAMIYLAGLCGAAFAGIAVTVTGTAQATGYGYTQGESYSFTWELSDNYQGSFVDSFSDDANYWYSPSMYNTALFADIYGDGLGGAYVRSDLSSGTYSSTVYALSSGELSLQEADFSDTTIGLTNSGEEVVALIAVLSIDPAISGAGSTDVAGYFSARSGTYAAAGEVTLYLGDISAADATFDATSMTITPEPCTMALMGLGGLFVRRRQKAKGIRQSFF